MPHPYKLIHQVVFFSKCPDCFHNVACFSEGAEEEEENEEPVEDLLKPGHLTQLLEEELAAEVEALCVGDVSGGLERLLSHLRTHRDSCQPPQLQVPASQSSPLCELSHKTLTSFCGSSFQPNYLESLILGLFLRNYKVS